MSADRARRERLGVDARAAIQSARFALDYEGNSSGEWTPAARAELARSAARRAFHLAAEFRAKVEAEAKELAR